MDEDLHFSDLTDKQRELALLLLIFGKASEMDGLIYASDEQKKSVEKMWRKLQVGMKGYPKFGGERSTITEAVQFTQNDDGTIGYRVVGERKIKKIEFTIIGMRDEPAKIRTVVSTGKIMQDGYIMSLEGKSTDTVIKE